MKKLLLLLLFYITIYSTSIWSQGLVAYYPFNNNVNDESGNGRNGVPTDMTFTQDRFGNPNKAASFNGTTSYIGLPGTWGGTPELTISAWVRPSAPTNGIYAVVSSNVWGSFLHFQISDSSVSGIGVYTSPTIFDITPSPTTSPLNQWRHLVLVIKSGASKVYENGVEITSSTQTFTSLTTSANVCAGRGYNNGRFFNGDMDDIRIYSIALTESEIINLYHENK